jgi:rSAM/selenodomain-associated transferase 2
MVNSSLTVLIPTLNEAGTLPACLAALAAGAALIHEIIIIDAGSTDATTSLASGRVMTAPPSRGGQLAAGIAAARTEWLLLLHADTILSPNWPAALAAARPDTAYYFQLRLASKQPAARVIEAMAARRCRFFALPYGDQGLLISKTLLSETGGMPNIPIMEDVALARALRGRLQPLAATATTSARRYERDGWLRRPVKNLFCLALYLCGTPPEKIRHLYG